MPTRRRRQNSPKQDGAAQDYIVFHKEREFHFAEGTAIVNGQEGRWAGLIPTDPVSPSHLTNEDPFVWTREWLFSYCHASQMRRAPQPKTFVQPGSRLFFCLTSAARAGFLEVDTVFRVAATTEWRPPGTVPPEFAHFEETSHERLRHLRHGAVPRVTPGKHTGVFTYVAEMKGASFLPLDEFGCPLRIAAGTIFDNAEEVLRKAVPDFGTTYPIELDSTGAAKLLALLEVAPERITGITSRWPLEQPPIADA